MPEKKTTKKVTESKAVKKISTKTKKIEKNNLTDHGKRYQDSAKSIDKAKAYELKDAIKTIKKFKSVKFDSSVEIHVNLNIDPKKPEEQIRGSISLPAGLGKSKKIAVVCSENQVKKAKEYGAEIVGGEELVEKIEKGFLDFEVLVATPDMMGKLAKAGKILGPKGLMPNPKDNTVTNDIKATIEDIKKGRAEYRADSNGIIHSVVGKVSFDEDKLLQNIETFLAAIHAAKPTTVKGTFVKSIFLTTTMGPSIRVIER